MFTPSKKHTVDHLKEISDEVRELHPVLNALFKRLPGIEKVHYTQGPDELGADFILYRRDEALLRTACIGVVVKAGPIRQNTSDVDRQIKECFIQRKAPDGTTVQIREVWVVSSQDITRNAKEVLAKEYADRKIEFIPAQDLADLIDRHAPDAFETVPPALLEFGENSIAALEAEEQRSLIVPGLSSFYVEPRILLQSFDAYGAPKQGARGVMSIDDLIRNTTRTDLSIVIAPAGGGKSRLAREITRRALESTSFAEGRILPKVIHAKDLTENTRDRLLELSEAVRVQSRTQGTLYALVDGFDEVDLDDQGRYLFVEELSKAASAVQANVVLLSRPFDEVVVLGTKVHSLDIYKIEPLRGTRALEFLKQVAGQLDSKSRLVADLGNSVLLRALDGAPIAYILLGRLIAENQQDLPSNLTELFQKYTELVLGRWEMAKGLRSQQEYEVLVEALCWLASYVLENELTEIGRGELERWISAYCKERGIRLEVEAMVTRACSRDSILYLRSDTNAIGFRHRAFSEFFHAKDLHRRPDIAVEEKIFSPYWINSYFFLAGLKRDCPGLVQQLSELPLTGASEKIIRVFNLGNLLLAAYLTPTKYTKAALVSVAEEMYQLYDDACDPTSSSPLVNFPTIQILGILTIAFSSQYGYRHFKVALEEAIFELESEEPTERLAVMLFMLDTAYKDAGGDLRFDELIEKFGDSLPLEIKLGIGHESKRMAAFSDRIRKMEKKLRRSLQVKRGPNSFLRKLYRTPVKDLDRRLIERQ